MKIYDISIGSLTVLSVRVRSDRAHEEGQINKILKNYRGMVLKSWQTQAVPQMERLYNFLIEYVSQKLQEYEAHLEEKRKEYMDSFPPHSIFCEKRCCQKSFRSYHQFLKKELKWSKEGHLL